jgi:hypothetical protein
MSSSQSRISRRSALKRCAAAGIAFPFVMRAHTTAAPSETLYHASFGAAGMARADIDSLTASPHVKLVAVADVDKRNLDRIKDHFPGVKVYQDWRELLDKEKSLKDTKLVSASGNDHYLQFVEACRGNGKTSAAFDYSGPLTESVLLGCLATRFPEVKLEWDHAKLNVTNCREANAHIRRPYRKAWEIPGL